jgi:acetylornithine deacetylase/succinyl-diaminopimelate desuccinylase
VEEGLVPRLKKRKHPLLGNPTINLGTIAGGDQPSTVAGRCAIQLDRRWIPGETVKQVFAELETILAQVRAAQPGLRTCMRRVPGGMATMVHGPLETSTDHPLARAAFKARRQVHPVAFPAWTDAALLSHEGGIPSIILGPGDLALAHSPDESVPVAELEEAAMLYVLTALDFCI